MDTDVPENDEEGRRLTDRLYGGDVEKRLRQEIVLGIGGLRALRLAGIRPTVMHLNEGHCAFALLERTRERIEEDGLDFHQRLGGHRAPDLLHHPHPGAGRPRPLQRRPRWRSTWAGCARSCAWTTRASWAWAASTWTTRASPSP